MEENSKEQIMENIIKPMNVGIANQDKLQSIGMDVFRHKFSNPIRSSTVTNPMRNMQNNLMIHSFSKTLDKATFTLADMDVKLVMKVDV
jgi:hypothetical protein